MAHERRIITSTHVSPQQSTEITKPVKSSSSRAIAAVEGTLENIDLDRDTYTKATSLVAESTYLKWRIDPGVDKTLGGKSSGAHVVVNEAQGALSGDGWTSMEHPKMFWENYNGADTDGGSSSGNQDKWDAVDGGQGTYWNGTLSPAAGGTQLLPSQTGAIAYCYIKNVGTTDAKVSVDGSTYPILLPAGAAVNFRGDGTRLVGDDAGDVIGELKVKAAATTYIEFVVAI